MNNRWVYLRICFNSEGKVIPRSDIPIGFHGQNEDYVLSVAGKDFWELVSVLPPQNVAVKSGEVPTRLTLYFKKERS